MKPMQLPLFVLNSHSPVHEIPGSFRSPNGFALARAFLLQRGVGGGDVYDGQREEEMVKIGWILRAWGRYIARSWEIFVYKAQHRCPPLSNIAYHNMYVTKNR